MDIDYECRKLQWISICYGMRFSTVHDCLNRDTSWGGTWEGGGGRWGGKTFERIVSLLDYSDLLWGIFAHFKHSILNCFLIKALLVLWNVNKQNSINFFAVKFKRCKTWDSSAITAMFDLHSNCAPMQVMSKTFVSVYLGRTKASS